jgi:hypothetical protein
MMNEEENEHIITRSHPKKGEKEEYSKQYFGLIPSLLEHHLYIGIMFRNSNGISRILCPLLHILP